MLIAGDESLEMSRPWFVPKTWMPAANSQAMATSVITNPHPEKEPFLIVGKSILRLVCHTKLF